MKANIIFLLLTIALFPPVKAQNHLVIGTEGNVVCQGNPFLVLNYLALNNSGNFVADQSYTQFTGNGLVDQSKVLGFEVSTFSDLIISNPANFVQLLNDIEVEGNVLMAGGRINLMDRTIHLMTLGSELIGETETSRITSPLNGYISWNHPLLGIATSNPGNLGAEITTAMLPGLTEVRRGHYPYLLDSGWSAARWYAFFPTNNAGLNATLRLHYLEAEIIGIPEEKLAVWKSNDNGISWHLVESSANNPVENWVEISGEDSLSMYTFGRFDTPSPMPLIENTSNWNQASELLLYPNPVERIASIYIHAAEEASVKLEWYNIAGQIVMDQPVSLMAGPNTFEVDVSLLPAGTYLLHCTDLDLTPVKMIKQLR